MVYELLLLFQQKESTGEVGRDYNKVVFGETKSRGFNQIPFPSLNNK